MSSIFRKTAMAAVFVLGASSHSYAQVEGLEGLSGMLSLDALQLDGLAGGDMGLGGLADMGSGLGGLEDLGAGLGGAGGSGGGSGDFSAIPFFGPVLTLLTDADFLAKFTPAPPTDRFALGTALVEDLVLGAIMNPEAVFSTLQELGGNASVATVPVLAVIMDDPSGLPDYFANGGTILLPAAGSSGGSSGSIFPGAPLLTDPLEF